MDPTIDGYGDSAPASPDARLLTDLLPGCPSRPPDWRWRRAALLARGEDRRRKWDDDWVARARRSLACRGRGGTDPAVSGALRLRGGPARRRWELEARLLAGQDDGEIAGLIDVEPDVVLAYERLFYEVRERLGCSDWVVFHAIGPGVRERSLAGDLEAVWKSWAYFCGPLILDALIESSPDEAGRRSTAIVDPRQKDLCDLAIAATRLPATAEDAMGLLRLRALIREIDLVEAGRGAPVTGPIAVEPGWPGHAPCAPDPREVVGNDASAAPAAPTDPGRGDDRRLRTAG